VIALLIGVAFALRLPARLGRGMLSTDGWVGEAIASSATIILITGAGGAFGRVLQESELPALLGDAVSRYDLGLLLPFVIAAVIKTAQGSSTVAMITTASLVAPLLETLGVDTELGRAFTTVAIGAGAMMVSHVNDSYFWVVTQFTGMTVRTGLRLQTAGTLVQGVAAGAAVWAASALLR
jgi:gluconate:H+ symporter, GntP family